MTANCPTHGCGLPAAVHGHYSDIIGGPAGPAHAGPRGANVVSARIWPLLAGLLRQDPAVSGALYLAVGSGEAAWDKQPPVARSATTRLVSEVARERIDQDNMAYLDADGLASDTPTGTIRLAASFTWAKKSPPLREFGLFGNATGTPGSGFQIDYVIHPTIVLDPGTTLTRTVDLAFGVDELSCAPGPTTHWLAQTAVRHVDGVGKVTSRNLEEQSGITTVAELAFAAVDSVQIPSILAVTLRGRCRLILRAAAQLPSAGLSADFAGLHPEAVVVQGVSDLVTTGTAVYVIDRVRELLTLLETCLDHDYLNRFTVGELASPNRLGA